MNTRARSFVRSFAAIGIAVGVGACSGSGFNTVARDGQLPASTASCPQARATERAPDSYFVRANPLPRTAANIEQGRRLYERDAQPEACASCHGLRGDGLGERGRDLAPPPRNFACAPTMASITDGQMYWVIRNGSGEFHLPARQGAQQVEPAGRRTRFTAMRAYREQLTETETWQLVMYLRSFAPLERTADATRDAMPGPETAE
jgi:mono/diheme cytochrome c family protein